MKIYKITGMDCDSCAKMIELDLEEAGIKCSCSYSKSELVIEEKHKKQVVIEIIKKSGYTII